MFYVCVVFLMVKDISGESATENNKKMKDETEATPQKVCCRDFELKRILTN